MEAFLKAFNAGNEKAFLDLQEQQLNKTQLERRTREERADLYKRMRSNMGTLTVAEVLKSTPLTIQLSMRSDKGVMPIFTFDFEEAAPFKVAGISVEVEMGERN